jgi:hypothetical protein
MTELSVLSGDEQLEFIEPWRCGECNNLMYNKDQDGYATFGAPMGLEIKVDEVSTRVCLMCAEMYIAVLRNPFMVTQHKDWIERRKKIDKIKSGNNYLDR